MRCPRCIRARSEITHLQGQAVRAVRVASSDPSPRKIERVRKIQAELAEAKQTLANHEAECEVPA